MSIPEQPAQPQQPYSNGYQTPPQPLKPSDEKLWSTLTHLSGILLGGSGFGFAGPLIAYLVLKDRGPFVRAHTAAALNYQISFVIYAIGLFVVLSIGAILTLGLSYFLYIPFAAIYVIFMIVAAVAANRGEYYKYPLTIEFVK